MKKRDFFYIGIIILILLVPVFVYFQQDIRFSPLPIELKKDMTVTNMVSFFVAINSQVDDAIKKALENTILANPPFCGEKMPRIF